MRIGRVKGGRMVNHRFVFEQTRYKTNSPAAGAQGKAHEDPVGMPGLQAIFQKSPPLRQPVRRGGGRSRPALYMRVAKRLHPTVHIAVVGQHLETALFLLDQFVHLVAGVARCAHFPEQGLGRFAFRHRAHGIVEFEAVQIAVADGGIERGHIPGPSRLVVEHERPLICFDRCDKFFEKTAGQFRPAVAVQHEKVRVGLHVAQKGVVPVFALEQSGAEELAIELAAEHGHAIVHQAAEILQQLRRLKRRPVQAVVPEPGVPLPKGRIRSFVAEGVLHRSGVIKSW